MSRVREKRIELFKINKKLTLPLQGLENKGKKKKKKEIKGIKMLFVKKIRKGARKKREARISRLFKRRSAAKVSALGNKGRNRQEVSEK